MKKLKILLSVLCLTVSSQLLIGQAMVSDGGGMIFINKNMPKEEELDGKRGGFFGSHPLGEDIQNKFDLFQKKYVKYESSGGAYATEKRVVFKKEIFNSVNKIDKYFRKAYRKDQMSLKEIEERYGHVLDVANEIRFYNTQQFEALMSTAKSEEQMIKYYESITFEE